ncbi:GNAT family N-acetyltransferase [Streptomyces turgidiscabies]|nr:MULTISPECIES: GNAT family N-acetyltransferase [Streptomyces]MDX3494207.1 GNAT family N-acetyltransferase [Streptomyces turgidiscabies]GAQ68418.1 acetyltransferase (GNAT) family protein [Streptomyces turgidiscabies]
MTLVRRATTEDAAELLRLRQVMIDSMTGANTDPGWQSASLATVTARLAEPAGDFAAFVVDRPDRAASLAALAVGTVEYRIGRAGNPHGRIGYVFSVATDPDARRQGYARACMEALVDWFREQEVGQIDLTSSADAEPLYASLGFVRQPDPFMRLRF